MIDIDIDLPPDEIAEAKTSLATGESSHLDVYEFCLIGRVELRLESGSLFVEDVPVLWFVGGLLSTAIASLCGGNGIWLETVDQEELLHVAPSDAGVSLLSPSSEMAINCSTNNLFYAIGRSAELLLGDLRAHFPDSDLMQITQSHETIAYILASMI